LDLIGLQQTYLFQDGQSAENHQDTDLLKDDILRKFLVNRSPILLDPFKADAQVDDW
jgi:hypothetical protein